MEINDDIDIREMVAQNWLLLVVGTVLGAALLLAASFAVKTQYRVATLLAPVDHSAAGGGLSQLGGAISSLGALAGVSLGEDSSRFQSIAVLESKLLTTGFISDHDLLPILFANDWDSKAGGWRTTDPGEAPSLEDGYRLFDEKIRTVNNDAQTGLVTLSITWSDRDLAARWANQLVQRANSEIRTTAIDEYRRSIEYLNEELAKTTVVGIQQAIYSVIESQIESIMLAKVREDYAFKVLDPAMAPDADDTQFPNRALFAFIGLVLGFTVALLLAYVRFRRLLARPESL